MILPVPRVGIQFSIRHLLVVHWKRKSLFVQLVLLKFLFVSGHRLILGERSDGAVLLEQAVQGCCTRATLKVFLKNLSALVNQT